MLIKSDQKIAGQPILKIRHVLRRARDGGNLTYWVTRYCQVGPRKAAAVIATLEEAGYIRPLTPATVPPAWTLTLEGTRLAQAAARSSRRRTADRALAALLLRVGHVNEDDYFLYRVDRMGVFGSYLANAELLGDVDIAIRLIPKDRNQARREQRFAERVEAAQAAGRRFGGVFQELQWPLRETLLFLKHHSQTLAFHDWDSDRVLRQVPIRWVYTQRTGVLKRPRLAQPTERASSPGRSA